MKTFLALAAIAAMLWATPEVAAVDAVTACVSKVKRDRLGVRSGDFYRVRTNGSPATCLGRDERVALSTAPEVVAGTAGYSGQAAVLKSYGDPAYLDLRLLAEPPGNCDLFVWMDPALGTVTDLVSGVVHEPASHRQILVSISSDLPARLAATGRAWLLPDGEIFRFDDAFVVWLADENACEGSVTVTQQ